MSATGVRRGVVIGVSRGAISAFALAARNPDRVSGLVLAFPVAAYADLLRPPRSAASAGDDDEGESSVGDSLSLVFSADYLDDHFEAAAELLSTSPGSVSRVEREDEDPFEAGSMIRCPTLVVEGGQDRVVSAEHPARYLSEIPGSRHVLVPEASHGWLMERPGEFAEIVAGFAHELLQSPRC